MLNNRSFHPVELPTKKSKPHKDILHPLPIGHGRIDRSYISTVPTPKIKPPKKSKNNNDLSKKNSNGINAPSKDIINNGNPFPIGDSPPNRSYTPPVLTPKVNPPKSTNGKKRYTTASNNKQKLSNNNFDIVQTIKNNPLIVLGIIIYFTFIE